MARRVRLYGTVFAHYIDFHHHGSRYDALLFETSMQALILIPLVTSIVFGMQTSTLLIMFLLPSVYGIMEDIGFVRLAPQ